MISKACLSEKQSVSALALSLWPEHEKQELETEMEAYLKKEDAAVFMVYKDGFPAGFAICQLRRDYVEGTKTSPVGYLEGLFVEKPFRGKGYGARLLNACEIWAKEQGCTEFASDCELSNTKSFAFHMKTGFKEVNRTVSFIKKL